MKALANLALSVAPVDRGMVLPVAEPFAAGRSPWGRVGEASDARQSGARFDTREHATIDAAVTVLPAEGVIRRRAAWHGTAVETVDVTRHGRVELRFRAPVHLLVLLEAGTRSDGLTFVEGLPGSGLRDYRRKLIFVPAGHEFVDWQETRALPRLAFFYFDSSVMPLADKALLAPRLFFEDAELWNTALRLKSAIEGPRAGDRSYCEALGVVLAHDLARFVAGARRPERHLRGGLAAWQQQAVVRRIDERLAEQVPLAELAGLVRLSTFHFSRAFKQSFGMPPHRFHCHRRIERAKALLMDHEMSVTQVGVVLGFSSASSFSMAFRKVTGTTPSDHRRSAT
jgi:AraC family transcriptional regulator